MAKYVMGILCFAILLGCKSSDKKKHSDDGQITVEDLFDSYNKLKLPFNVTEKNLSKLSDSAKVDYALFKQFVPDTIFNNPFGDSRKFTIHPIGKIQQQTETYLTSYVTSKTDTAVYLSVFNNKKFSVSMPLLVSNKDEVSDAASIDKKLSIVINKEWTEKNEPLYRRTIYAYNNVGLFTTILTETNVERSNTEAAVINPLDTFARKNKYSGDYIKDIKDKKNLLSIRDGKTPGQYLFFIHFQNEPKEEGDEECGGELKGQFTMTSENTATFTQNGDPCSLQFTFEGRDVKVKENGSCGNHRGIRCFFNDTYSRKKEAKLSTKTTKKKR